MDKDYIKGLKIGFGIFTALSLLFGIVFAIGFHSAEEIVGGTFTGDFIFQDNVKFQNKVNFSNAQVSGIDVSIPSGMIVTFNLSECPNSWKNISTGLSTLNTQVAQNLGTPIGTLTQQGGLAAAFDENTYQDDNQGAYFGGTDGWIGKEFSSPKNIIRWVAYGSSTYGFHNPANGNINNIWIQYSDDGTSWFNVPGGDTGSFPDSTDYAANPKELIFNSVGAHRYWRLNTDTVGANRIAELYFYEKSVIECQKD